MMMNQTWVNLASIDYPEGPAHLIMRRANELHEINNPHTTQKPFSPPDIGFTEFMETIRATSTQRELDLVYVSNLYNSAWTTLHVSMAVLNEKCKPQEEEEVKRMYQALCRLDMPHLLTDGLSPKWLRWVKK